MLGNAAADWPDFVHSIQSMQTAVAPHRGAFSATHRKVSCR
jgi:hypothetical protein